MTDVWYCGQCGQETAKGSTCECGWLTRTYWAPEEQAQKQVTSGTVDDWPPDPMEDGRL